MSSYDDSEPPLDPAQERLRRKLVRLLFVSGGIMMLGLIAVFSALVYKVGGEGAAGSPAALSDAADANAAFPAQATIDIPAGTRLLSADLDGNRALLRVEAADGAVLLILVDLRSGNVLARYAIETR